MKKIPSLFKRNYGGDRLVRNEVTEGCEWVLAGEGDATNKYDGTSCRITEDTKLWRRYELKRGKTAPEGFEAAQASDPHTGEVPGWIPCDPANPADRYHFEGLKTVAVAPGDTVCVGTYELVGPKVQGNPHQLEHHVLVKHGLNKVPECPRDFEGIKQFLEREHSIVEGIVWHHPDGRMAKIKRKDFFQKGHK